MDSMPTASTAMNMVMATTTSAAMSSSSSGSASSMSKSMGMGMGMGSSSCKITMLWNWTTVDACFLSRTWHITSKGMFAGTCIGVISLVLCLEFLRRVGREYEAFIVQRARRRYQFLSCRASETSLAGPSAATTAAAGHASTTFNPKAPAAPATLCNDINNDTTATHPPPPFRPSLIEQLVRATLHMLQFAVAYFVMLLAMYFNGYIIICIFIGAFLGAFIFSWETIGEGPRAGNDATAVTKCCG